MLKINNYLDAENKSKIVNFEGEGGGGGDGSNAKDDRMVCLVVRFSMICNYLFISRKKFN